MSSSEPGDHRSILFLEQIEIETNSKRNIRIKLQIDDKNFEIQRVGRTGTWIPSRSLELADASTIIVTIKTGHAVAGLSMGRLEAVTKINVQEAMEAFWASEDSISHQTTFDEQPATITLKLAPSPTSKAMRAAVQELQKDMNAYVHLMSDSTEHAGDLLFKSGAVLADMNPIVKMAFSVAKGVFEILKEQKKRDDAVVELADGVHRILPFAELVIEDIICEDTELLEGVVGKLCTLIKDTASFLCGYAKQSLAVRLAKSTTSTELSARIKSLTHDFAKLEREFDRAVDVTALKMAKKNEEFRLLDRLKPTDAAGYQDGRSCMEGTRTGILKYLTEWSLKPPSKEDEPNGPYSDNMYWLYGSPGLGKTSIANSLCEQLHGTQNLGGSFFCRRDDPILREPRRVLPTLISKLAGMWGPYRKLVAEALQNDPQLNPESKKGEVLLSLIQSAQRHPPRTFVLLIDALDECGDPVTRKPLLESLIKVCTRVYWIKVIITSRPEHDIRTFFGQNNLNGRDLAKEDQTQDDIELFTRQRMASIATSRYLPMEWPGEERIRQIIDRASGLFVFVETVCRYVDDHNPKMLLAKVLEEESGEANAELYKLYSVAIVSKVGTSVEEFRSLAQAVVVAAIYRPLPDETLASLMELEHGVVRSLVDGLSSILYRDAPSNGGVRVRHLSVIEFLTGPACPEEFRVVLPHANEKIGLQCLTTMAKELKFNICELENSCLLNAEIPDIDDRVCRKISDALQYSCIYWAAHLCWAPGTASMEVCTSLDELFTTERLLHWVEALSLMGETSTGILALREMKAAIKKFQHRHRDHVDDTLRFLLAFSTPISTSAPHIYVSALPFSPRESILWNNASKASPKLMNVYNGRLKSWPLPSGTWLGHQRSIHRVIYSPDGLYAVSGSGDATLRIWDAESGATVGEPLTGHTDEVRSVAYSSDGQYIASGSDDKSIRIWDAKTGAAVGEPLMGHTATVYSVAYSPDTRRVASGSYDGTIRIWDVESGAAVGELKGHVGPVFSVAYSPNGRHIASGSYDHTVRIWDADSGAPVGDPLRGHSDWAQSVAYSQDGRYIVSGSDDKTIRIWDAESGAAVGEPLRGHSSWVVSIAYCPDGRRIVSGSDDNTIKIWDMESGELVGDPLEGHTSAVLSVAYSPDGRHIISGSHDGTIRTWDAESGATVGETLRGHSDWVRSVAYSPDGRYIASGSDDSTIQIWDAESGEAVGEPLREHTESVQSVAYSLDGRCIVSGSDDGTIRIWDAGSGGVVGEPLVGHTGKVLSVAYSPDGRHIASGSDDNTVRIWDAESGETVGGPLVGHTGMALSVAYSPDGRHIVSCSHDKTIRIWNAESGATVGEPLKGHENWVASIAFSPDGRHIVSSSADDTIRIWDIESGTAVGEPLRGHNDAVWSVACSPDARHIVSGSYDGTIRIWDAEARAALGEPLLGHTDSVRSLAYSPDGQYIVSGSDDNTVRIWDAGEHLRNCNHTIAGASGHRPTDSQNERNGTVIRPHPLSALSCVAVPPEQLNEKGWVVGPEGLLFWVPEPSRYGLTHIPVMTIGNMQRDRAVRIDLKDFRYGTSWTEIYENRAGDNANVDTRKILTE